MCDGRSPYELARVGTEDGKCPFVECSETGRRYIQFPCSDVVAGQHVLLKFWAVGKL